MAKSFASIKNRKTDFSALQQQLNPKPDFSDDRFWYPQRDDAGNGAGIIRFLPERPDAPEGQFFVETQRHGFEDVGGKYYMECRTALNKVDGYSDEECPVCQANQQYIASFGGWDSTPKAAREARKKYWRKTQRISNVYVVSDPANPENEGQVFLFKYGRQVVDKLEAAISPKFPNDPQFDPFDMYEGANFHFKVTKREGQTNNENSVFMPVAPLFPDDDPEQDAKAEAVWRAQYDLGEFIAEDKFESYDVQLARWNKVTGGTQPIDGSNFGGEVPTKSAKPTMAERAAANAEAKTAEAPEADKTAEAAEPKVDMALQLTPESVSSFFDKLGRK